MIKNMLQAASRMLVDHSDDAELVAQFRSRVQCAKIIIDEIVAGMDGQITKEQLESLKSGDCQIPIQSPKKSPPPPKKEYALAFNPDKTLKEILDYPMDKMIDLDGKKMAHKDAVGKAFMNIQILEP